MGHLADAQQPKKVQKIGLLLGGGLPHASSEIQALGEGLRQFGYIEGQNIALETGYGWTTFGHLCDAPKKCYAMLDKTGINTILALFHPQD